MKKKIIILSTIYPYPIDNGKKVVLSGILDYLKTKGYEIVYVVINNNQKVNDNPLNFRLKFISPPKSMQKMKNLLFNTLICKEKSIQESMIYSTAICKEIKNIVLDERPDIILYDTVRAGQFKIDNYEGKEIVYLDDLFSIRYHKMKNIMRKYSMKFDALGNFKNFVPKVFQKIVDIKIIQMSVLELERKLIAKSESKIASKFSKNLLINCSEVKELKERTKQSNIFEIRPFLNAPRRSNRNYQGSKKFIFLGALNIPHNSFSILHFIKTQMDRIIEVMPDFELLIIGKDPKEELLEVIEIYSNNIRYLGYVDDLESIMNSACALIIPLLFGTGVKLKTIEALNVGIPVISTSYGTEGINLENGLNCIIEDDLDKFVYHMEMLTNIEKNNKISTESIKFFEKEYGEQSIYSHYDEIFN